VRWVRELPGGEQQRGGPRPHPALRPGRLAPAGPGAAVCGGFLTSRWGSATEEAELLCGLGSVAADEA